MKNKEKEYIGFAIAEFFKNGRFKGYYSCSRDNGHIYVSGYGEIYYSKKQCQGYVNELNRSWGVNIFKCVKVNVILVEKYLK